MEINESLLKEFIQNMNKRGINNNDLMYVIENLSYLASDNGFDREGFFDVLIDMMNC